LFPCYVFIYGGFDNPLEILKTPGLINVVAWAGHQAIIPPGEISSIRRIVESALRVEPYPFLHRGDRVRVVAGPLIGIEGIMVPGRNRLQLVVSLKMLGRSAAVEIEISSIERIASAGPVAVWPVPYSRSA
jgi:transcription antitermination factor NusG